MKFKRGLLGLAASLTIVAPVSLVVACGPRDGGSSDGLRAFGTKLTLSNPAKTWFVANNDNAFDQSFNESTLQGLAKFSNIAISNNLPSTYNYRAQDKNEILSGYNVAVSGGAEVVVGSGFEHVDNAVSFFKDGQMGSGTQFIGVDTDLSSQANSSNNMRLASISFPSEQAGYLAGLYAVEYLNTHSSDFENPVNGKYQVAAYGGMSIPPVLAWMNGFKKGVQDADANLKSGMIPAEMIYFDSIPSPADFTNDGFTPSSKPALELSRALITKGADIILPVAGGQIKQTLQAIKDSGKKAKVIGVDGDQFLALKDGNIIGSALKNISEATKLALLSYYRAKSKNDMSPFIDEYVKKTHMGTIGFVDDIGISWTAKNAKTLVNLSNLNHENVDLATIQTPGWN